MDKNIRKKKAWKKILAVILIIIVVINLITIVITSLGLRKHLNWMPIALLTVTSGSMEPKFSAGDAIVVADVPYDRLERGDIITYYDSFGGYTTHELIRRGDGFFITRGLANEKSDDPVNIENYCAKLVMVLPKAGTIIDFFTRPIPAAVAILILFVLFFVLPLFKGRNSLLKNCIALALSSVFALTPFMTAARYRSEINDYQMLNATSTNFSSNYMQRVITDSEGQIVGASTYAIQGWPGITSYTFNVDVRNYSNELRINNSDVPFVLHYEKLESYFRTHDGVKERINYISPSKYELRITTNEDHYNDDKYNKESYHNNTVYDNWTEKTSPSGEALSRVLGPYLLPSGGEADNLTRRSCRFSFSVKLKEGISILERPENVPETDPSPDGAVYTDESVGFCVMSCTNQHESFYQELASNFTLQVAEGAQFITYNVSDTTSAQMTNSVLTLNIDTKLVGTGEPQNVFIYWDAEKIFPNEADALTYYALFNPSNERYDGISDPDPANPRQRIGTGYAIIKLGPDISTSYQFIKYPKFISKNLVDSIYVTDKNDDIHYFHDLTVDDSL